MRRAIILALVAVAAMCGVAGAYAADAPSLADLIDQCLKNNPQVQAAQYRYEAAKARVRLLATLKDPVVEYEYDKISVDRKMLMEGGSSAMRTLSVSQEFPFPTKLFLRRQAAAKEADSLGQEYKETQRKVVQQLKEEYYRYYLSRKKSALTQELLDILSQVVPTVTARYSVGKATMQDSLLAQAEYAKLSNQLVLFAKEQEISRAMLMSLTDLPSLAELGIREFPAAQLSGISEEKAIALTKANRPELISFRDMMRKAEIGYTLSKQEYLPDVMLKYRTVLQGSRPEPGEWAASVGVTVPLWFWDKQAPMVREAYASLNQARAEYKAAENMSVFESRAAFARLQAAIRLVSTYETGILPQAKAAFSSARAAYEAQQLEFTDLLAALRGLKEVEMEYYGALADVQIAEAELERLAGAELLK